MKSISLRILFAIVLSLMCTHFGTSYIGCNGATGVAAHFEDRTDEAVLDRNFKIKYGQELTVKGGDLKLKFASVLDDSRCPANGICIWAGDAKILIGVRRAKAEESQIELHTYGKPTQAKYQEYVIRLVALDPYPGTETEGKRSDYVATLLIKKE